MGGDVDVAAFAPALQCFVVADRTLHAKASLIAFEALVLRQARLLTAYTGAGDKCIGEDYLRCLTLNRQHIGGLRINLLIAVLSNDLVSVVAGCIFWTLEAICGELCFGFFKFAQVPEAIAIANLADF